MSANAFPFSPGYYTPNRFISHWSFIIGCFKECIGARFSLVSFILVGLLRILYSPSLVSVWVCIGGKD